MMKMNSMDIQQQQFKIKFRGFDVREVDGFLDQVAEAFEALQKQNDKMLAEIQRLRKENRTLREQEEAIKTAMLSSQRVTDQMKENARRSAELIISEAEVKAEKMLSRAHSRLAQLQSGIDELKRQRIQIEVKIRSILEAHSKILEMGTEELHLLDEEDARVRVLGAAGRNA